MHAQHWGLEAIIHHTLALLNEVYNFVLVQGARKLPVIKFWMWSFNDKTDFTFLLLLISFELFDLKWYTYFICKCWCVLSIPLVLNVVTTFIHFTISTQSWHFCFLKEYSAVVLISESPKPRLWYGMRSLWQGKFYL